MFSWLAGAKKSAALPLFSRTLGEPCAKCHDILPRLDAAGIAFAERGYRPAGRDFEPTWQVGQMPLSVVGSESFSDSRSGARSPASRRPATEMLHRGSLQIHSAGVTLRRISYHVAAGFEKSTEDVESEAAFVQVDDLIRGGALNLKAGHFDAGIPFLSQTRRTTLASYLSPVAFDARGLELNGRRSAWTYAAGLALSDRRSSGGTHPSRIGRQWEDTYLRMTRNVGAQSVAAQMLFDRQDSDLPTLTWLQHLRAQVAGTLCLSRLTIIPSYVFDRFDDRPAPGLHERHQYYLLETLMPLDARGCWAVTGRYEHDYRTRNAYDPEEHRDLATLDLGWQATENARVAVEWAHADERLDRRHQDEVDAYVQASW